MQEPQSTWRPTPVGEPTIGHYSSPPADVDPSPTADYRNSSRRTLIELLVDLIRAGTGSPGICLQGTSHSELDICSFV
jgi:hypothetical protein